MSGKRRLRRTKNAPTDRSGERRKEGDGGGTVCTLVSVRTRVLENGDVASVQTTDRSYTRVTRAKGERERRVYFFFSIQSVIFTLPLQLHPFSYLIDPGSQRSPPPLTACCACGICPFDNRHQTQPSPSFHTTRPPLISQSTMLSCTIP